MAGRPQAFGERDLSSTVHVYAWADGIHLCKAVKKITDDLGRTPRLLRLPAECWIHLRTTNPIESTFATVRLCTKVARGAGRAAAALGMVLKLVELTQARW